MSVPEASMKEVMPCEMSSLGFHLPVLAKEKIWAGNFVDVLSFLPASNDFIFKTDKRGGIVRRRKSAGLFRTPLIIGCRHFMFLPACWLRDTLI